MTGWIYVMSNPSMPGLSKIGMSAQDPKEYRVKELSQATGVPEPFVVQYQALVDDERTAEKQLHSYFSGYRHNKEFFKDLSVATVITMAREHFDIRHEENLLVSDEQIKHEKLSQQKAQEDRDREEERNRQAQQKKREAGWLSDIAEGRERFEKWFAASQDQRLKEDKHITEVVVGKAGKKMQPWAYLALKEK